MAAAAQDASAIGSPTPRPAEVHPLRLSLSECMVGVVVAAVYFAISRSRGSMSIAVVFANVGFLCYFLSYGTKPPEARRRATLVDRLTYAMSLGAVLNAILFVALLVVELVPPSRAVTRAEGAWAMPAVRWAFAAPVFLSAPVLFARLVSWKRQRRRVEPISWTAVGVLVLGCVASPWVLVVTGLVSHAFFVIKRVGPGAKTYDPRNATRSARLARVAGVFAIFNSIVGLALLVMETGGSRLPLGIHGPALWPLVMIFGTALGVSLFAFTVTAIAWLIAFVQEQAGFIPIETPV